jgi:hypothetical protein
LHIIRSGDAVQWRQSTRDDVVQEGTVVAHDEERAAVVHQQLFQQFKRFQVEVVGRFVHHEHV